MSAQAAQHPVTLVVRDDLERSRVTVFFRLLLAIPHYLWAGLFLVVVAVVVFLQWWVLLVRGRPAESLHEFTAGFIRYITHVEAYVLLAANPFPGFFPMSQGEYPVDLEFAPPAPQNRWKTAFRLFLAVPALMISGALMGGGGGGGARGGGFSAGVGFAAGFLLWWVGVFRGRVPRGLRDLAAYCIGYGAQAAAYLFLVTDRYPYTGPNAFVDARDEPPHPVRVTVADDLRRSRVLVLFRLPVAIPHLVWLLLWGIVAFVAVFLNWLVTLATGQSPRPFHRFLSAYVRYGTHVWAFVFLVGNPFPGFVGKPGTYPVDVELPDSEPQRRLVTLFRLVLYVPALIISGALWGAAFVAALLGWFVAIVRGEMPDGLRNLGAYALRYAAQSNAYLYVLTERYPDSGPRPDPASP